MDPQCTSNNVSITCCTCRAIVTTHLTRKLSVDEELMQLRKANMKLEKELIEARDKKNSLAREMIIVNDALKRALDDVDILTNVNAIQTAEMTELMDRHLQSLRDKDDIIKGQREEILELHNSNKELNKIIINNKYDRRYDFPTDST